MCRTQQVEQDEHGETAKRGLSEVFAVELWAVKQARSKGREKVSTFDVGSAEELVRRMLCAMQATYV